MGVLDTSILFAYLAVMIGLGFYANYKQQGVEDYFVAGRRMGPFTIACLWLAAWVGGAAIVGSSSRSYELGVTGVWYMAAMAIGCLLFGVFMATRVKDLGDEHGHLTYPDLIEERFDSRTRIVATVTTILAYVAYTAGQLIASAAILQVLLGWDYNAALILAAAIVVVYTATGGYLAVTYTDWIQFILLMIGILLIGMPIAIQQAGTWGDLQAALPPSFFDLGAQGWGSIVALSVALAMSFFVGMDSYSRCFAARDRRAARNGTLLAVLFMMPLAVASVWLGLASAVLFPDAVSGNGILTTFILETFPVGLKGLVLVAVLAAVMSSADICILTASANYSRDIHQRYLQPDIRPKQMLRLSMLSSLVVGGVATFMAFQMQDIIGMLQLGFTINAAALFLPTVAALYMKKVDSVAAFWSICLSLSTVVGWRIASGLDIGGADGIFSTDPLWPGLIVSAVFLLVLSIWRARGRVEVAAHQ